MKTELQKHLATLAPSVSIETIWSPDPDLDDIRKDCDGFEDADPSDWQAWQTEVRASVIIRGQLVTASSYLGGTWELASDDPSQTNPDVSGYERGMTHETLAELFNTENLPFNIAAEIMAAINHLT